MGGMLSRPGRVSMFLELRHMPTSLRDEGMPPQLADRLVYPTGSPCA
jgi:hypothetical protein